VSPIQYFIIAVFKGSFSVWQACSPKIGKNYLGHKNRARNLDEITLLLPDVGTVEYRAPDIDLGSHPDISSGFGRKGWLRNTCLI
jgi:hypothetical protein